MICAVTVSSIERELISRETQRIEREKHVALCNTLARGGRVASGILRC